MPQILRENDWKPILDFSQICYNWDMAGLTCNIDKTGRRFRAITGAVILAIAIVWYLLTRTDGSTLLYVVQALLALGGAFAIFEGAVGWCAIRAMGIKTRI